MTGSTAFEKSESVWSVSEAEDKSEPASLTAITAIAAVPASVTASLMLPSLIPAHAAVHRSMTTKSFSA